MVISSFHCCPNRTFFAFQVEKPAIGLYVSKLRSHEMLPWGDWITKHLVDTYGSLRGTGPTRVNVNETDLVQIKENLG